MNDHEFAMTLVRLGNAIQRLQATELNEEQMNAMIELDQRYWQVANGWVAIREERETATD